MNDEASSDREKLLFLGQHRTLAAGIKGEQLIARLVGGLTTKHTSSHDVDAGDQRIEVKLANLSQPSRSAPTSRWQWQKILGERSTKQFDWLLLVGVADARFRSNYRDPSSPYVLFLVPRIEVDALCTGGSPLAITLNSNPIAARGRSAALFKQWQVTADELERSFGHAVEVESSGESLEDASTLSAESSLTRYFEQFIGSSKRVVSLPLKSPSFPVRSMSGHPQTRGATPRAVAALAAAIASQSRDLRPGLVFLRQLPDPSAVLENGVVRDIISAGLAVPMPDEGGDALRLTETGATAIRRLVPAATLRRYFDLG